MSSPIRPQPSLGLPDPKPEHDTPIVGPAETAYSKHEGVGHTAFGKAAAAAATGWAKIKSLFGSTVGGQSSGSTLRTSGLKPAAQLLKDSCTYIDLTHTTLLPEDRLEDLKTTLEGYLNRYTNAPADLTTSIPSTQPSPEPATSSSSSSSAQTGSLDEDDWDELAEISEDSREEIAEEPIDTELKGYIAIPFVFNKGGRFNENHIVMILIDQANKTVEYYDSKGEDPKLFPLADGQTLHTFLNHCNNRLLNGEGTIKINPTTHQNDVHHCGAYVIRYLYARVMDHHSFEDYVRSEAPSLDIHLFREWMSHPDTRPRPPTIIDRTS